MSSEKIMVAGCDVIAYLIECPPFNEDLTEEERIEMAQYIEKLKGDLNVSSEKIMVAGCDVLAYLIECPPVDDDFTKITEEERIEMAQYIEKHFSFSDVYDQFDNLGQIYWREKQSKLREAEAIINKLSDEELAKLGLIRFSKS